MRRVGEVPADVRADLGDDGSGGQPPDPGDGDQQVAGGAKRLHHRLGLRVQLREHAVEVVQVVQVQPAQHGVVVPEPALQRHRQVRDLRPHPADGQVRQHGTAPLPVDQRLDHQPSRLRGDGPGHGVELDARVLQHVPEAGDLADPLLRDLRPVADHVPGRLDLRGRDEAASQQPALQQLRQPLRVRHVRLAARHVLHVPGIAHQDLLEGPVLQQRMVDGHRVDPGRLHRHVRDSLGHEPPRGLAQHAVKRLVHAPDGDPPARAVPGLADRDRDHVLAHVNRRAPLVDDLHDAPLRKQDETARMPPAEPLEEQGD